ncbi:MAG TPA: hypothetical protein VIF12_04690 [Micavibrio sp.]
MVRLIAIAAAALMLSSCSTILEDASQDLKINIVGTGEALCYVSQTGRLYRAYAPSVIHIQKSDSPMTVRCLAPGNREQTVVLESKISNVTAGNIANGVIPGAAYDYFSGAMFKYPDSVTFDFSDSPPKSYPLPDYQLVFDQSPDMMGMEEFRPGKGALMSDKGRAPRPMQRRPIEDFSEPEESAPAPAKTPTVKSGLYSTVPEEDK